MKNRDLIEKLQSFPLDMEVCLFDINVNEYHATEEPSLDGVYNEFCAYIMYCDDELSSILEYAPDTKNFIALEFDTTYPNTL